MLYQTIVLLPLLGAIGAGLFGKWLGHRGAEALTCTFMVLAALLSCLAFVQVAVLGNGPEEAVRIARWVDIGTFEADWALRIDTLTAVMLVVVNGVSSLVHIYSIGYMSHDPHRSRFFAYLSLFTFAMLMLVTADNFLQLFFGWEGVGLASYLLIGFWYTRPSANAAAMKAFIVNRVGDFGFALGIMAIYFVFGSVEFDTVFAAAPEMVGKTFVFLGQEVDVLTTICILLFIGAMGKSAQFLLHTWLPDAMEGPTPVSALIHAATMVTAGVFLVCRCSYLFEYAPTALELVTIVGAVTAFFAASVGLVQNDIKRVIAYSTCSQLGYMFFAAGVGAYGAAMFHLFTHAFFKALLFLGSGSVIHAMSDEQDMRKMGGLLRHLPWTSSLMIIGTLAITGVGIPGTHIGFAGFVSKDIIIERAFEAGGSLGMFAFWIGVIAAVMTSYYSWRLIYMTFFRAPRASEEVMSHVHESPRSMLIPLVILAGGAVLAGSVFYDSFVGKEKEQFWNESFLVLSSEESHGDETAAAETEGAEQEILLGRMSDEPLATDVPIAEESNTAAEESHDDAVEHGADSDEHAADDEHGAEAEHHVPTWVLWAPFVAMSLGFGIAWLVYIRPKKIPEEGPPNDGFLYNFLLNKWYFDELYDFLFVKPAMRIGRFLWKKGDGWLIDGFGPDGVASAVLQTTKRIVKLQTGYVYHYAFAMLIGIALLVTYYYARGAF